MREYLYPYIKKADLIPIILCVIIGALLAGLYGAVHDQVTFAISPEYFRQLKFTQFKYLNFGFTDEAFAAIIGFFATWWFGAFIGWCFGRRFIPNHAYRNAVSKIRNAFLIVLASTILFGLGGYIYGLVRASTNLSAWSYTLKSYDVVNGAAFLTVLYIHIASYLGAIAGLIAAFLIIKPNRKS